MDRQDPGGLRFGRLRQSPLLVPLETTNQRRVHRGCLVCPDVWRSRNTCPADPVFLRRTGDERFARLSVLHGVGSAVDVVVWIRQELYGARRGGEYRSTANRAYRVERVCGDPLAGDVLARSMEVASIPGDRRWRGSNRLFDKSAGIAASDTIRHSQKQTLGAVAEFSPQGSRAFVACLDAYSGSCLDATAARA